MDYVGCKFGISDVVSVVVISGFIWTMWDVNSEPIADDQFTINGFIWTMWDVNQNHKVKQEFIAARFYMDYVGCKSSSNKGW